MNCVWTITTKPVGQYRLRQHFRAEPILNVVMVMAKLALLQHLNTRMRLQTRIAA
jgi:hypothetical protein